MYFQSNVGASVGSVMQPAGFENAQGILSAAYAKDGADPQWDNDEGMQNFYAFLAKYAAGCQQARRFGRVRLRRRPRPWCRCSSRPATI